MMPLLCKFGESVATNIGDSETVHFQISWTVLQARVERKEHNLPQFVSGLGTKIQRDCTISALASFEVYLQVARHAELALDTNPFVDALASGKEELF